MSKVVQRLHLARALAWIPLTIAVFGVNWQNVVAITFLYSAYANFESGIAVYQGRRSERAIQAALDGILERLDRIEAKLSEESDCP